MVYALDTNNSVIKRLWYIAYINLMIVYMTISIQATPGKNISLTSDKSRIQHSNFFYIISKKIGFVISCELPA